jgi:hypothetical protein
VLLRQGKNGEVDGGSAQKPKREKKQKRNRTSTDARTFWLRRTYSVYSARRSPFHRLEEELHIRSPRKRRGRATFFCGIDQKGVAKFLLLK